MYQCSTEATKLKRFKMETKAERKKKEIVQKWWKDRRNDKDLFWSQTLKSSHTVEEVSWCGLLLFGNKSYSRDFELYTLFKDKTPLLHTLHLYVCQATEIKLLLCQIFDIIPHWEPDYYFPFTFNKTNIWLKGTNKANLLFFDFTPSSL